MNVNWKEMGHVCAFGGIGGLLSFVYSVTAGICPLMSHRLSTVAYTVLSAVAYVFLGMGSALLGVYLLAKTDTRHVTHCLAFAVACGLSWAPIMDAACALIKQHSESHLKTQLSNLERSTGGLKHKTKDADNNELISIQHQSIGNMKQIMEIVNRAQSIDTIRHANGAISAIGHTIDELARRDAALASEARDSICRVIRSVNSAMPFRIDHLPFKEDFLKRFINLGKLETQLEELERAIVPQEEPYQRVPGHFGEI